MCGWNNKHILINNKSVYYRSFHEAGIVCINDLLGNTEKFKNVNTWCKVFNNVDYLRWYGIIQAIPATWRAQITTKICITEIDHGPGFKTDGDLMLLDRFFWVLVRIQKKYSK